VARKKRKVKKLDPNGPARKLIDVSSYRTTGGVFIEGLTPYPAEHESYTERYTIASLALCHDVVQIKTQADVENYIDMHGKKRRYIPDILVDTKFSELTIEVKTLNFLFQTKAINKYQQIGHHYSNSKKRFAFLTDAQIEDGERFKNIKILFRYAHSHLPNVTLEKLSKWDSDTAISIANLMDLLELQLVEVYTAIAQKHLCIDWDKPLSKDVLISHTNKPLKGLSIEHLISSSRYGCLLEQLAMGDTPSDKRLLVAGTTWRQPKVQLNAFSSIGAFQREEAMRDLTESELRAGTVWSRRNRAPGKTSSKNNIGKNIGIQGE
jgi:hypothetical protein